MMKSNIIRGSNAQANLTFKNDGYYFFETNRTKSNKYAPLTTRDRKEKEIEWWWRKWSDPRSLARRLVASIKMLAKLASESQDMTNQEKWNPINYAMVDSRLSLARQVRKRIRHDSRHSWARLNSLSKREVLSRSYHHRHQDTNL